MNTNVFDKVSFWSLFLTIVFLPVFFLPFTNVPIEISKGLLVSVGLVVSLIFWAMARFSDGKVVVPKSPLLLSGFGVVFIFLLSSIFSSSFNVSMFGIMLDVGTFWFMFAGFLLMFLSSIIFQDSKKVTILLVGMVLSSLVLLIFQGLFFFFPKFLGLGVLSIKTDNLLGSWRALGFFAGLFSLVSLFSIEFFTVTKMVKWFLGILLFLSLALVSVVASSNFPLIWGIIGTFALIIFVYKASRKSEAGEAGSNKIRFPMVSFAVVTISILFFMSGQFVGGFLSNHLGISNNEVSPSFKATMMVAGSVLRHSPLFGIGPNRFGEAWAMYKPEAINTTQFWDVAFNSGSGFLPTLASTTGYVGILSIVIFLLLFLVTGAQSIFTSIKRGVNYKLMAFFIFALYLFIVSVFYSTGFVLSLLAFVFTGVFIGLSSVNRNGGDIVVSFLNDHRKSFFFMLVLIFIMISSVVVLFKYGERFASVVYFRKALSAPTVQSAESYIGKAVSLYPNDLYLKTYSQVYLLKLNALASKDGASLTDADKSDIKISVDQAVSGAEMATAYNSKNYLNFQTLGSMYQGLSSFGVKDANVKAIEAYKIAATLNPLNPKIQLAMAGASFTINKDEAKNYANKAIALKPDYVDAYITLSQIAKSSGDIAGALSYAETALSYAPANKDIIKYVDSLKTPVKTDTNNTKNTTSSSKDKTSTKKITP